MANGFRALLGGVLVIVASTGGLAAEDAAPTWRTAGLIRAHWDYPAKASAGFGVITGRLPANFSCQSSCLFRGVTVQGAAGLGGGEIAVGYGSLVAGAGSGRWLLRRDYVGYGVRLATVRTWGRSNIEPEGATFLGVEGAGAIAQFGFRLGLFHQVESGAHASNWRVFGGLGWGF